MLKLIIPFVAVLVLGIGGFFLYQNFQTKSSTQLTSTPPTTIIPEPTSFPTAQKECSLLSNIGIELPKLDKKINWTEPVKSEFSIPLLRQGREDKLINGCLIKSGVVTFNVASEIRNYFQIEEMPRKGWVEEVVGDGAGTGISSWSKNGKYFVVQTESVNVEPPTQIVTLFYTQ